MPAFIDLTLIAAPLYIVCIIAEFIVYQHRSFGKPYSVKDAATSITMGLGDATITLFTGSFVVGILMSLWSVRFFDLSSEWWVFPVAFLAYDFAFYWKHRWAHRMRWFWTEHVPHHSSEFFNFSTALRQPWVGPLTGSFLIVSPLVILGFHPLILATVGGLNLIYQFGIHTNTVGKLNPIVEFFLNTPSHHRVHHARNPRYLDSNYGGVLILWDRIFGTFVPELDEDPVEFGLVKPLRTHNPLIVAFHELGGLLSDLAKDGFAPGIWLKRLWKPPGWNPPTSPMETTEVIKHQYIRDHPSELNSPGLHLDDRAAQRLSAGDVCSTERPPRN